MSWWNVSLTKEGLQGLSPQYHLGCGLPSLPHPKVPGVRRDMLNSSDLPSIESDVEVNSTL